jgi:hypothetical protein
MRRIYRILRNMRKKIDKEQDISRKHLRKLITLRIENRKLNAKVQNNNHNNDLLNNELFERVKTRAQYWKTKYDDLRDHYDYLRSLEAEAQLSNRSIYGVEPANGSLVLINSVWGHFVQKLCSMEFVTGTKECMCCHMDAQPSLQCSKCNAETCARCLGFIAMQKMVSESERKKSPCVTCPACRAPMMLYNAERDCDCGCGLLCDEELDSADE